MAIIIDDFRKYLGFYLSDYMASESMDWNHPNWSDILDKIDAKTNTDFRYNYLKYFLWAMNDELLSYYKKHPGLGNVLRQSTKVLFIMDGEFLRFNDDETKTFIHEMYRLSGVDVSSLQLEPVEHFFEDLIHFIGNFIDWHKKERNIPLSMW
jgi:hypothetical protein